MSLLPWQRPCRTRLNNMRETLKRMMVEPDRVRMANLGITDDAAYVELVAQFLSDLRGLGPSPFKA